MRDEHQLHAAVVELVALDDAEIKYSTVQNWYPGDEEGRAEFITLSLNVVIVEETIKNYLDPSRDWFSYYLEISKLYFKRK